MCAHELFQERAGIIIQCLVSSHTRVSNKSLLNVSVTVCEILVPVDSGLNSLLPAHLLSPSKLMELIGIDGVTQIVEFSIRNKGEVIVHLILLSKNLEKTLGNVNIRELILSSNIVDTSYNTLVKDAVERASDIGHVKEVTGITSISMNGNGQSAQNLVGELGDQLLRELMGSVYVVTSGYNTGELEGAMVGFDEEFRSGLGGSVWVGRFEDVLFVHGLRVEGLTFSVYLIGGYVDESPHGGAVLGALEEYVGSVDVRLGECEGVTEGVVDVGLCCEVHDGVDFVFLEGVVDEITARDVSLDEFEVGELHDLLEVLEA
jgi:hypothetical protein